MTEKTTAETAQMKVLNTPARNRSSNVLRDNGNVQELVNDALISPTYVTVNRIVPTDPMKVKVAP